MHVVTVVIMGGGWSKVIVPYHCWLTFSTSFFHAPPKASIKQNEFKSWQQQWTDESLKPLSAGLTFLGRHSASLGLATKAPRILALIFIPVCPPRILLVQDLCHHRNQQFGPEIQQRIVVIISQRQEGECLGYNYPNLISPQVRTQANWGRCLWRSGEQLRRDECSVV